MKAAPSADVRQILAELEAHGLLLQSDARLPSIASLVAGEPVRGSWWGHPRAHAIFRVSCELAEHPDVVVTKLVSGKITFVHRRLWPALVAVASARESWQLKDLSRVARALLAAVTRRGTLRTDAVRAVCGVQGRSVGPASRELEQKLLVHSEEFHAETGAHAKRLQNWSRWARQAGFAGGGTTAERARQQLEQVVADLNGRFGAEGRLPWRGSSRVASR